MYILCIYVYICIGVFFTMETKESDIYILCI